MSGEEDGKKWSPLIRGCILGSESGKVSGFMQHTCGDLVPGRI